MKHLQFQGASGEVVFDPKTGTRNSTLMNYQMLNLLTLPLEGQSDRVTITPVHSTEINLGMQSIVVATPLIYKLNNGSSVPPMSSLPIKEDMNLVPTSVRAVCWCLSAVVMICSTFFMVWTFRQRNLPRVRASQPIFLVVLCVGTLLMGLSIVFVTLQEPVPASVLDASCMAQIWCLSLGFDRIED